MIVEHSHFWICKKRLHSAVRQQKSEQNVGHHPQLNGLDESCGKAEPTAINRAVEVAAAIVSSAQRQKALTTYTLYH